MKFILSSYLFLFSLLANAQAIVDNSRINTDETLQYSIMTICKDAKLQKSFQSKLMNQLREKPSQFVVCDKNEAHPDIIIGMEGTDKDNMTVRASISTLANHSILLKGNIHDLGKTLADTLYKYYYSGRAPQFSTIFTHGEKGYFIYRIPTVVTLPTGRVIAITETRSGHADCAENDIVAKISDDKGKTWSELMILAQAGENSLNNPTVVYVEEINRILLVFQDYTAKLNEGSAKTGLEGKGITHTFIIHSDDNGKTWSSMKDITKEVKISNATGYCSGPGIGIRVVGGENNGRIILPFNVSGGADGWYNYLCYSDDLGETWKVMEGKSNYGTNESQVVQLSSNDFLINARCHKARRQLETKPKDWNPWNFPDVTKARGFIPVNIINEKAVWGETVVREDLIDPLCQGSILRVSGLKNNEPSRILVSNPASTVVVNEAHKAYRSTPPMRINGVARISYDEAQSFAFSKRIHGNRYTDFYYSVLTNLGNGEIGCIFETRDGIKFASFNTEWLTSGKDKGL